MLPLSGPTRVEAMFAHTPAASEGGSVVGGACLLHFQPGDNITLLISEPRDGWHYGQNERTGRSLFLSKANSTSTGQLDKLVSGGLPALTPESEEEHSLPPQRVSTFRPRPYSMADSNKITSELTSPPSPTSGDGTGNSVKDGKMHQKGPIHLPTYDSEKLSPTIAQLPLLSKWLAATQCPVLCRSIKPQVESWKTAQWFMLSLLNSAFLFCSFCSLIKYRLVCFMCRNRTF
ncbi:hypothetical protein INR49_032102 [Caranx melampygus]|nr:hypothetical protein INR49_032102 [Caranx melampygus]